MAMPMDLVQYCTITGAKNEIEQEEKERLQREEPDSFIIGDYRLSELPREFSFDVLNIKGTDIVTDNLKPIEEDVHLNRNDCLVYCVNYACRVNLFTNKEQVMRFVAHQLGCSIEKAQEDKIREGVDMRCFTEKPFACYQKSTKKGLKALVYLQFQKIEEINNWRD
jgi:hypothetical protein